VRAYQGGHRATAGVDDVQAPKHEEAPLFKVVALLLARARRILHLTRPPVHHGYRR
jgi:hypothetical protein